MRDYDPFRSSPSQEELVEIGRRTMAYNFRQRPIVLVRGEGMYVWDRSGRRYLDFVGGLSACGLGHSHPCIVDAIERQARQLLHVSNIWFNEPQVLLAQALSERFGDGRVFLCNSGTEANEAALKLARRWATRAQGQPERSEIVAFHGSFHGRTMGSLSVTGRDRYKDGFEPMMPGVQHARFGDLEQLSNLVTDRTCAVFVEPVQVEGGLVLPEPGYLAKVAELCRERGALLVFDEVQAGCGRTGTFFCYEQEGLKPDIVTLAKSLGAGVPIAAMISTEDAARGFEPGSHGTTFGGNPLAARAALAFLGVLEEDALLQHVGDVGRWFAGQLERLADRHELASGPRGRGLLLGLGLERPCAAELAEGCRQRGLLVNALGTDTIRFLPPLIVERSHIRAAVEVLSDALADLERSRPQLADAED